MKTFKERVISRGVDYDSFEFAGIYDLASEYIDMDFTSCKFKSCDFSESVFRNCTFEDCYFDSCNLSNVKFEKSSIITTKFKSSKLLGINFTLLNTVIGQSFDFNLCELSYSNFYGMKIPKSIFIGCNISDVEFSMTDLSGSSFIDSEMKGTTFFHTDIGKCDFRGAKNYLFSLNDNKCKGSIHSYNGALDLLRVYGIKIE